MTHRSNAVLAQPSKKSHLSLVTNGTTPRKAQDPRLITVKFDINAEHAPALRSAIEEISDAVATRVEGKFQNPTEHALTCALVGLGQLRAALYPQVPAGDPAYRGRRA